MRFVLLAFAVSLVATSVAWADFNAGLKAYYRLDFDRALAEWRPLAQRGDRSAQYQIGVLHYRGEGVAQDFREAAKWFRLAAEGGDADGQFNLGLLYVEGKGVPKDFVRAHMWLDLAASGYATLDDQDWAVDNYASATSSRDWVAARMTTGDIVRAQQLARMWQAKP